jgi:hypothetical protein
MKMLKQRTIIIMTTQMSNAFCHLKTQSKQIFDVPSLQFALNTTIKLFVHTLQLSKMSQWVTNMRKLKKYVTVKFSGKTIHKLNCDGPIVKGFQFTTNVRN